MLSGSVVNRRISQFSSVSEESIYMYIGLRYELGMCECVDESHEANVLV